jgi:hypothetical protein
MPAPAQAVDQQSVWKNDEMQMFARALVRAAVKLMSEGVSKFTTDIVGDADRGTGTGIAGSVVTQLKNANVIEAVGHFREQKFYAERERSTREGRKDAWNNVYRLTSHAAALEYLSRNHEPATEPMPNVQPDLLAT